MDKGVVVDLGNDIEGFVPMSQLGVPQIVENPGDAVKEGQPVELQGARGRPDPSPDRAWRSTGYPDEPIRVAGAANHSAG